MWNVARRRQIDLPWCQGHDLIYVFTKLTPLLWRSDMEAERPVGRRLWLARGEMIVAWTKLVMVRITEFWVYFGGR